MRTRTQIKLPGLLDRTEAANLLGITTVTLRNYEKRGFIKRATPKGISPRYALNHLNEAFGLS